MDGGSLQTVVSHIGDVDEVEHRTVGRDLDREYPAATGSARQAGRTAAIGIQSYDLKFLGRDAVATSRAMALKSNRAITCRIKSAGREHGARATTGVSDEGNGPRS